MIHRTKNTHPYFAFNPSVRSRKDASDIHKKLYFSSIWITYFYNKNKMEGAKKNNIETICYETKNFSYNRHFSFTFTALYQN